MNEQPDIPKRRKGADHFGYGHQVALGKHKDGKGLWHSWGRDIHNSKKSNTYWCGHWGNRTPEELLSECESVISDMRLYHPELFRSRPAPAPIDDIDDLEELGNQDIDPKVFAAWGAACERGAQEQFLREYAAQAREDFEELIEDKCPTYPSDLGDMVLLSDIQSLRTTKQQQELSRR